MKPQLSALCVLRALFVLCGVLAAAPSEAQPYQLSRVTLSSGVLGAAGPTIRLGATLGEAGVVGSTAGAGTGLVQGFWWPQAAVPVGVAPIGTAVPVRHALLPPAPNPFRSGARLSLDVAQEGIVTLDVFDVSGRLARRLLHEPLAPGRHRILWDGRDGAGRRLASGVFYARLETGGFTAVRRLLLLR